MTEKNTPSSLSTADKCRNMNLLLSSEDFKKLNKYYRHETFMDISGTARTENIHSNFLAWLFDSTKQHNLKSFAVKKLLEAVVIKASSLYENNMPQFEDKNFFKDFDKNLLVNGVLHLNYDVGDTIVRREWSGWSADNRLDILIEFEMTVKKRNTFEDESLRVAIAIENKVDSSENNYKIENEPTSQTELYWNLLKNIPLGENEQDEILLNVDKVLPIFLTPLLEIKAVSKQFFTLDYQTLLDDVLEPCLEETDDLHSKLLIEDYIRCLGQATLSEQTEQKKEIMLMAVGKSEQSIICNLLKNHKDAIIQILKDATKAETQETNAEKISSENLYIDYYMIPDNRQFYRSLFFAMFYMKDPIKNQHSTETPEENDELIKSLKAYKIATGKSANKKTCFYLDTKTNEYKSHGKEGKTLGKLGYDLIKAFCTEHHDKINDLIVDLREKINPKKNPKIWLAMVCVRRSELEEELIPFVDNGSPNYTAILEAGSQYGLWNLTRYVIDSNIKVGKNDLKLELFKEMNDAINMRDDNAIKIDDESANDIFVARWWDEFNLYNLIDVLKKYNFCSFDYDTRIISRRKK